MEPKLYTTTAGSSLTCTVTTYGTSLVYCYQIADSYGGSHTVTIDGVSPASGGTVANQGQNGAQIHTANGSPAAIVANIYPTTPGVHTVVITMAAAGLTEPVWMGGGGHPALASAIAPPVVYVATMSPKLGTQTDTMQAAFTALNHAAVVATQAAGLNVIEVSIADLQPVDFNGGNIGNGFLCPAGTFQPYHPGDCGHQKIRRDFESAMRPVLRSGQ